MNGATFGRVNVLGVRVDAVTERQYLDLVAQWVEDGTPRQVVTINPEFVMRAQVDPDFAAVLARADLATPDGVGIIWAARRQGVYLRERSVAPIRPCRWPASVPGWATASFCSAPLKAWPNAPLSPCSDSSPIWSSPVRSPDLRRRRWRSRSWR